MSKTKIAVRYYTQFTLLHKNRPNSENLKHVEEFTKNFLQNRD